MRKSCCDDIYAVVLVGGAGKRLKPLSTEARPKAFISVTRDRMTMFAGTINRIGKIVSEENILVVANKRHIGLVKEDFPGISRENMIAEPVSRNTAPAIMAAASVLQNRKDEPLMVVLSTDQYIKRESRYLAAIKQGIGFVKANAGAIVTVGIRPDSPSTQLGYIRAGITPLPCDVRNLNIYKAEKFVEKPGPSLAEKYYASGRYLWNSGIFIFKASTIISAIKKYAPAIANAFDSSSGLKEIYNRMPDISIDYAVMERSPDVYCVKGDYDWMDMGSFDNIRAILKREGRGFIEKEGKVVKILS